MWHGTEKADESVQNEQLVAAGRVSFTLQLGARLTTHQPFCFRQQNSSVQGFQLVMVTFV